MPEAPALTGAPEARSDSRTRSSRNGKDDAQQRSRQGARASSVPPHDSVRPLVPRKWISQGNVTSRPRRPNGSQVPFFDARVVSRLCETVPMALSPIGDGHQTRTAGRGDRGDPWGDHHPAPFSIDRCGRAGPCCSLRRPMMRRRLIRGPAPSSSSNSGVARDRLSRPRSDRQHSGGQAAEPPGAHFQKEGLPDWVNRTWLGCKWLGCRDLNPGPLDPQALPGTISELVAELRGCAQSLFGGHFW